MSTNPSRVLFPIGPSNPFRVNVRGRPFLAGSLSEHFPETIPDIGGMIPTFAFETGIELLDDALSVRKTLDDALAAEGGCLLRGLPLKEKSEFEVMLQTLGYRHGEFEGGIAVRQKGPGTALIASQEKASITLSPHNEMAYLPKYPGTIFFFCQTAADRGGEVPINDIRHSVTLIPGDVQEEFRAKGIRYFRNVKRHSGPGELGWIETFGTHDRHEVDRIMESSAFDHRWIGDTLQYSYNRPAFARDRRTGEMLWFNQVTELHSSYWRNHPDFPSDGEEADYPATTAFADGTTISPSLITFLRGVLWQTTRAVRMGPGDVLALDNRVLQHGRFSYEGERRHYVSLAD